MRVILRQFLISSPLWIGTRYCVEAGWIVQEQRLLEHCVFQGCPCGSLSNDEQQSHH